MRVNDEEFLRYYWEELLYLRRMGVSFARTYPKIAARLELEADQSPDPHVERLIESFAFLTARIQNKLDNDFPEIATELLSVLYPHFVTPTPSITITRFELDHDQGQITAGFPIPRHTSLYAPTDSGAVCRFRTCYPVELWPVEVEYAAFEAPDRYFFLDEGEIDQLYGRPHPHVGSVLRLRLESRGDPFEELEMRQLRFFLHGDSSLVSQLYELLFNNLAGVLLLPVGDNGARARPLPRGVLRAEDEPIRPVGFGLEEAVLPAPDYAQPAYRLLHEYFAFPEKFHFFDLTGLRGRLKGSAVDVLILFNDTPRSPLSVEKENFVLGATPIINLFEKTSEPIRLDQRRLEYRLVADQRWEKHTEVHSILKVSASSDPREASRDIAPFYAFDHDLEVRGQRAFWHGKRVLSLYKDVVGTEMLLSFLDLDFKPVHPPEEIVFAHTLCTNRALPEQIPAETLLFLDEPIREVRPVCMKKPTRHVSPPLKGQTLWRLISHLSLNFLSLAEGKEGIRALREILRLYSNMDVQHAQRQITGIQEMAVRPTVHRFGGDPWRGFARGMEITLIFEASLFTGGSAFLMASVLNQFFGLYASTNSFTRLVVKRAEHGEQQEGVWKKWPPMAGAKRYL